MGTVKSLHDRLRQDEAVKEQRPCVWLRYPHALTPRAAAEGQPSDMREPRGSHEYKHTRSKSRGSAMRWTCQPWETRPTSNLDEYFAFT